MNAKIIPVGEVVTLHQLFYFITSYLHRYGQECHVLFLFYTNLKYLAIRD